MIHVIPVCVCVFMCEFHNYINVKCSFVQVL